MIASKRELWPCLMLLFALGFLNGCATKPVESCSWVKPIYPSRSDVLSRGTAQQIVTHNETWQAQDGKR